MNERVGFQDQILGIGHDLLDSFTSFAPKLLIAIGILILGMLVGAFLERLFRSIFKRIKGESLLGRMGMGASLERFGFHQEIGFVLGRFLYFFVVVVFAQNAIDILGLAAVSAAMDAALDFVPKMLGALLIILVGVVVARFLGRVVENAAEDSGIEQHQAIRQVVTALVVLTVIVMAVSQLGADPVLIRSFARFVFAGAALGLGLTFGLGTRDTTKNLVAGFYLRKLFRPGESIVWETFEGKLVAITPVQTILQNGESTRIVANHLLLRDVTKRG